MPAAGGTAGNDGNNWEARRRELEQMVAEAETRLTESKRLRDEHVNRLRDVGLQMAVDSGSIPPGRDAEELGSLRKPDAEILGMETTPDVASKASAGVSRGAPNVEESASLAHPECRACGARDSAHSPHPGGHYQWVYRRLSLGSSWWAGLHPLCHHSEGCLSHAFTRFCNGFVMAYAVRVGIGFLTHGLGVIRAKPAAILKREELAVPHKKGLIFRADALRLGFFFGGFSGVFHALRCTMRRVRVTDDGFNSFVAGTGAGLSLLALEGERRRTLALYLLARVAQSVYNSSKAQGRFHPLVSQFGDTFLFCLASAQIMYAYIMHPNSLPPSYWNFIVRTGPISKPVLKAVRENNRGLPIDVATLSAHCRELAGRSVAPVVLDSPYPSIVPCGIVHPATPDSCSLHNMRAMSATFRRTFPLYLSLNLVPFVILNIPKFVRNPASALGRGFLSATRSTTMIALFVGLYQGTVCSFRKVANHDFQFWYYISGLVAGLSVLVEKKSRRSELALYTMPRAVDSLFKLLVRRRLLLSIPNGEVLVFCGAMGALMYYLEREPQTVAPLVRGILLRFLYGAPSAPKPILGGAPHPAQQQLQEQMQQGH